MPRVKTFSTGGIQVESHRSLTGLRPIRPLFLPSIAIVPLLQYPGARCEWLVTADEAVSEEQVIARGVGTDDLPIHSPIPGRVVEFRDITLPGGAVSSAAVIRLEGAFGRTGRPAARSPWALVADNEVRDRIRAAGIVLESSPLDGRKRFDRLPLSLDALVVNALQPEPYLTLSQHLQKERADDLAEGVRILQKVFRPTHTHLVSDPEHPEEWRREFSERLQAVHLHTLQFRYPQAQEGLLLSTIGVPFAPGGENRVLTLDAASVLAVRDAVVEGKPQVEKNVVVSGHGIRRPGVYRVRIGTPLVQLLKDAGGLKPGEHKVLIGGPFNGQTVDHLSAPVLKSTQAVLVLGDEEVNEGPERPCIRCGQCVQACPVGLEPLNLHQSLRQGNFTLAREEGLDFCIECGICSHVCPSRVPLVSQFHQAKEQR